MVSKTSEIASHELIPGRFSSVISNGLTISEISEIAEPSHVSSSRPPTELAYQMEKMNALYKEAFDDYMAAQEREVKPDVPDHIIKLKNGNDIPEETTDGIAENVTEVTFSGISEETET